MRALLSIGTVLAATLLASACVKQQNSAIDLTKINSFKVEVTAGQLGTAAVPLAYTASGMNFTLKITALDGFAQPITSFAGPVNVSSEPGIVFGGNTITFSNGIGTGTVQMKRGFGVTRIWVEDPKTLATGVTDAINIRGPKISDIQISPNTVNSPFNGERVLVDDSSSLVVEALARDGFYITDLGVANGAWASIYAFTFGAPRGVQPGDRIANLSGTVTEFLGFTELNNPAWKSTGVTGALPAYHPITCTEVNAPDPNLAMEAYESSLVEVANATVQVCGGFPTCPDYDTYKQWSITLSGGCALNVVSNYSLTTFDPTQNHGNTFTKLRGTLRNIQFASPAWIFEPHSPADVCCPSCTPALTQGC